MIGNQKRKDAKKDKCSYHVDSHAFRYLKYIQQVLLHHKGRDLLSAQIGFSLNREIISTMECAEAQPFVSFETLDCIGCFNVYFIREIHKTPFQLWSLT